MERRFPCAARAALAVIVAGAMAGGRAHGDEPGTTAAGSGLVLQGRFVYDRNCVYCHGRRGRGDGPWAEGVKDRPRDFSKGVFKFRTTPAGALPTDADLERTIRNGIPTTMMPAFAKERLTDPDLRAVIAFVKSLSPRWADASLQHKPTAQPPVPEWLRNEGKRRARAASGAETFATTCAPCHGIDGRGNGPAAKGLTDLWGHPAPPADLTHPHHKSGPSPADLFRTIAMGLDGTPMAGFASTIPREQLWDLVAFIGSLEATPAGKSGIGTVDAGTEPEASGRAQPPRSPQTSGESSGDTQPNSAIAVESKP